MAVITWKLPPASLAQALEPAALSPELGTLDQVSACLPAGAYTTFRTFQGDRALELEGHLARLRETARLAGRPLALESGPVRQALRQVLGSFPRAAALAVDLRLRLTLDLEREPGALYISAEPLHIPPPEAYTAGVRVITLRLERSNPKAKLTDFIEMASQAREALPQGVHEAILVDANGRLLEGTSSNFFAVRADGIYTAEAGVLDGLTRRLALGCAAQLGLPVCREPLLIADLPAIDEAFITSSSRGILPVRSIDSVQTRRACPGPITRRLAQAYDETVILRLEVI